MHADGVAQPLHVNKVTVSTMVLTALPVCPLQLLQGVGVFKGVRLNAEAPGAYVLRAGEQAHTPISGWCMSQTSLQCDMMLNL